MKVESTAGAAAVLREEELRIRVSALIDCECDPAEADATLDALLASDDLSRFWADAHRAGDWIRSDEVVDVADGEAFMRRFSAALADEVSIVAAPARRRRTFDRRFWTRTGLPGMSVAAALVLVAWVAMPTSNRRPDGAATSAAVAPVKTVEVARSEAPAPAVTPVAIKEVDVGPLDDYVAAHREVTPFAYRGSARPASLTLTTPAPAGSAPSASSP